MPDCLLLARWLVRPGVPPIEDAAVAISDGIVAYAGPRSDAPLFPVLTCQFDDAVIVPGFVNAHVHLDLCDAGQIPMPGCFPDWLLAVVAHRRNSARTDPEHILACLRHTIRDIRNSGTTLVGDIWANTNLPVPSTLGQFGLPGVSAVEVIGHRSQRYEPLWRSWIEQSQKAGNDMLGISPHAPYSTAATIYHRTAALTAVPLRVTHWLESPEERQFLATGRGPMRDFLECLGALDQAQLGWSPPIDPWRFLLSRDDGSAPMQPWTLVHANQVNDDDMTRLALPSMRQRVRGFVYCPRTHAHFGFRPHPWRRCRQLRYPVGLGTDSLASNPDLSVFNEAKFLVDRQLASPGEALEMLTAEGAAVLGEGVRTGRLAVGQAADLVVLRITNSLRDPFDAIFSDDSQLTAIMIRGEMELVTSPFA